VTWGSCWASCCRSAFGWGYSWRGSRDCCCDLGVPLCLRSNGTSFFWEEGEATVILLDRIAVIHTLKHRNMIILGITICAALTLYSCAHLGCLQLFDS